MQIKDLPKSERPQEKLIYSGASSLSSSELLALIIRTGNRDKSAIQLAEDVLAYSNNESGGIYNIEVNELQNITGIGVAKACSVVATIELARRLSFNKGEKKSLIKNASDAAEMLMKKLRYEKKEHLIMLVLNMKCEVEAEITISIGALDHTIMHPREILSKALKRSAAAILIAHNHPSGDPTPSQDDISSTKKLIDASEMVGIRVLDHIIIGDGVFLSMRGERLI